MPHANKNRFADGINDPWGNPYLEVTKVSGHRTTTEIISMGPDGKSESLGNDPDDIAPRTNRQEWLFATHPIYLMLRIAIIPFVIAIFSAGGITANYFSKRKEPRF